MWESVSFPAEIVALDGTMFGMPSRGLSINVDYAWPLIGASMTLVSSNCNRAFSLIGVDLFSQPWATPFPFCGVSFGSFVGKVLNGLGPSWAVFSLGLPFELGVSSSSLSLCYLPCHQCQWLSLGFVTFGTWRTLLAIPPPHLQGTEHLCCWCCCFT